MLQNRIFVHLPHSLPSSASAEIMFLLLKLCMENIHFNFNKLNSPNPHHTCTNTVTGVWLPAYLKFHIKCPCNIPWNVTLNVQLVFCMSGRPAYSSCSLKCSSSYLSSLYLRLAFEDDLTSGSSWQKYWVCITCMGILDIVPKSWLQVVTVERTSTSLSPNTFFQINSESCKKNGKITKLWSTDN